MKKKIKLKDIEGFGNKRNLEKIIKDWRFVLVVLLVWITILSLAFVFTI